MKIIILNRSPKGQYSITLQYIRYIEIEKHFSEHNFRVFNVSESIKNWKGMKMLFRKSLTK